MNVIKNKKSFFIVFAFSLFEINCVYSKNVLLDTQLTSKLSDGDSKNVTEIIHHDPVTNSDLRTINGKKYVIQKFISLRQRLRMKSEKNGNETKKENYTKCQTPNKDAGFCKPLEDCQVLKRVQHNKNNMDFLKASNCQKNETTPKYCCGKYENYKYLLPRRPLPKLCGNQYVNIIKRGKIFGGTQAVLGEYPWLARIIHTSNEGEKSIGCEGFLIHKRFILTAAHCVKSPRIALIGNITEIQLGEHNTQTEKDCFGLKCADPLQTMKVKSIIPHPEYRHNSRDHHYDIALIYLKGEAKFSDYVQPICLSDKPSVPEMYWISGWGKTENGTYSNVKLKLSIPPFDITECSRLYSRLSAKVGQSQFCAGGEENKDSCVGDSGGPLMFHINGSKWFAVGIVSYGMSCGLDGWPGVYTSIPYFYDWIIDKIIELREPQLLKKTHLL